MKLNELKTMTKLLLKIFFIITLYLLVPMFDSSFAYQKTSSICTPGLERINSIANIDRGFYVYKPANYCDGSNSYYPSIYLIPGTKNSANNWIIQDNNHVDITKLAEDLVKNNSLKPTIFIIADYSPNNNYWFCSNMYNSSSFQEEDVLTKNLIPYINNNYRVIDNPKERAVMGVSMGGFCAAYLTLKHPDLFNNFVSLSGFFMVNDHNAIYCSWINGWVGNLCNYFGNNKDYWNANSPLWLATLVNNPSQIHALIINSVFNDFPADYFVATLQNSGFDVTYNAYPGRHGWGFWSQHYTEALNFLNKYW